MKPEGRTVFISYSRRDEDMARALRDRLGDASINCFIDTSRVRTGDDWRDKISRALDDSMLVIVVCTKNSVDSHEVTSEWAYAAGRGLTIVPVIYEPGLNLPAGLEAFDRLDFVDPAHRQWDRLVSRILEIQQENPATAGVIKKLGIESVFPSRHGLISRFSVPQILSKIADDSELLVIGRSLEGWAREFHAIHNVCETRNVRATMALVDPHLDSSEWMIPTDYAVVDVMASIEKFKRMPPLSATSNGGFSLYYLPNSPLMSFTYYSDIAGPCGIFEISASLSFEDRSTFILRPGSDGTSSLLDSMYKVCANMLTGRPAEFSLHGSDVAT